MVVNRVKLHRLAESPPMLSRIAYSSTLILTISDQEIANLVSRAADFNARNDITGVIAIELGRVCQIIEGPTEGLNSLYASIRRDKRHTRIVELYNDSIATRHFGSWGMVQRPMIDIVELAFSI